MVAELEPYPAYKDSGVEWLGVVPAHWEVRRAKHVFRRIVGGSTPTSNDSRYWGNVHVWVTPADISRSTRIRGSQRQLTHEGLLSCSAELMPAGSIVVTSRAPVGNVALAEVPFCTNQGCKALVPNTDEIDSAYGFNLFHVLQAELQSLAQGTTFTEVSGSTVGDVRLPLPPLSEQTAIVRFLDHVDRRIRRYIRAKEKLIALLEEQRQAVVHEAVTGRIDVRTGRPYPEYKDSGVEWLGQVPKHWETVRFSRVIRDGPKNGISPQIAEGGTIRSFAISAIRGGVVDVRDADVKMVSLDTVTRSSVYNLIPGDILLVRGNGNLRLVGRAGLVEREMKEWVYPDLLMRVRLAGTALPIFIVAILNCRVVRDQIEAVAHTAVGTFKINGHDVRNLWVPVPHLSEQRHVTKYIRKREAALAAAADNARRGIELINEYGKRLIADVVTGKLDVREVAARLPDVDPLAAEDEPVGGVDDDAGRGPTDGRHTAEVGDPIAAGV